MAADLLEVLFPSPCVACARFPDRPLAGGVCLGCWAAVPYRTGPACPTCGRAHPGPGAADLDGAPCGPCRSRRPPFAAGFSMAWYRGPIPPILRALKFGARPDLAWPLARRAHAFLRALPVGAPEVDLAVPVPLPLPRRLRRGYNQAAEICRGLARLLEVPTAAGVLGRRLRSRPQAGLRAAERESNVRGAFFSRRPGKVAGRSVLLVDDVWTTGATLRECARTLDACGARRILAFSVARVPDDFDLRSGPAL